MDCQKERMIDGGLTVVFVVLDDHAHAFKGLYHEKPGQISALSNASSAEFVGGLRFGESSKRVKQGHFHGFMGSKAEGSSGNHSYLVVETLDGAA
jgi:hypothetical protein